MAWYVRLHEKNISGHTFHDLTYIRSLCGSCAPPYIYCLVTLTVEVVKDKLHVVHKFVRSHLSYHHPCLLHEVSIVVIPKGYVCVFANSLKVCGRGWRMCYLRPVDYVNKKLKKDCGSRP